MKGLRNRYNLSLSFPGPLVSDCAPTLSLNGLLDSHYLPDNLACSGPGRNLKLTISLMCYRVVRFKGESTEHPDKFVTLCDPMDCSIPGFPVFQYLPQFAQTHVHWVSDAIQPPHPLSSPSPPAFNLSQHQGLFQWVSCLYQEAKVLEFQLQNQSFQWTFRTDFLWDWLVGFPCSPRHSQESSPIPQFKSIDSWRLSFLYSPTLTSIYDYWKNHSLD